MLAFLLATALVGTTPPVPVSVTLNQNGRYLPGSGVQVTVQPGADGYLLVLNADPDGRVRVLFPLDPTDDAFVRGGRKYQLEDRGGRNTAFMVDWSSGSGTIFAALSKDPLQPGDFALNGHWDYRNLTLSSDDDEVALRSLAERIAPGGVQYDFSKYFIGASDVGFDGGQAGFDGGQTVVAVGLGVGWGMGWGMGMGWGWGWGGGWWGPGWGWGWGGGWGPGWGWGGGACCWGGGGWGNTGGAITPYRSRELTRTWGGQAHPGAQAGGVGVQGTLSGSTSPTGGYRDRSSGEPGVRGSLSNPASTSSRRQPGAVTPTSGATPAGATPAGGASRRVASDQAAATNASRAAATGGNRASGTQQVAMGTGRRQTNAQGYRAPLRGAGASTASGDMARRSGGVAAGSYSGRAGTTGSRAYGGTRSGGSSSAGRSSPGYGSRGPSASGSRGYGGSRGAAGGGMSRGGGGGGGSRGFSGGGGGGRSGGGGGGGGGGRSGGGGGGGGRR